jgi:hypothetical protein
MNDEARQQEGMQRREGTSERASKESGEETREKSEYVSTHTHQNVLNHSTTHREAEQSRPKRGGKREKEVRERGDKRGREAGLWRKKLR